MRCGRAGRISKGPRRVQSKVMEIDKTTFLTSQPFAHSEQMAFVSQMMPSKAREKGVNLNLGKLEL